MYYLILNKDNVLDSISKDFIKLRLKFPNELIYGLNYCPKSIFLSKDEIENFIIYK